MDWDACYDDVDEGWLPFLQQLRFAMTHHWGDDAAHRPPRRRGRRSDLGARRVGLDVAADAGRPLRGLRGR